MLTEREPAMIGEYQQNTLPNILTMAAASPQQLAWQDITDGLMKWRIWLLLAYQDILLRYRRSMLGPFWITISMAVTVYSMGFLYAHLFHSELRQYYPFLVAGMLSWSLIASTITDLTDTFVVEGMIKQIKLPYSLYIHRVVARNLIIFCHNIIVMIPILLIFHEVAKVNFNTLLCIPSLILLYMNAVTFGLILAMVGARYRDISQIIKSLIQVVFFVTPVMWSPSVLSGKERFWVNCNPFHAFVELIRAPLLGMMPTMLPVCMALLTTIIGMIIAVRMFTRYRARIIYWL